MNVCLRTCFSLTLFLCLLTSALSGQDCPSVKQALEILHDTEDEGAALHARIKAGCPAYLDTLSLLYHKRTVYAFSAGQPWAVTIGFALKTLAVQRELYADQEEVPLAKTLANLGYAYRISGRPALALPYLRETDAIYKRLEKRFAGQPAELANVQMRLRRNHLQLVYVWQNIGNYGQSEDLLSVLLAGGKEAGPPRQWAEVLRLHGVQAIRTEAYAEALPYLREAAVLFAESKDVSGEVESRLGEAGALFYLKRYEEAEVAARAGLRAAGEYPLVYARAALHSQLALIHNKHGDFTRAREEIDRGMEVIAGKGRMQLEVLLRGNLAGIAAAEGKGEEALARNAEAISLLVPGWEYSEETSLPTGEQYEATTLKVDLFEVLGERVEYMEQMGAAAGAMEVVRAGDAVADLLRADFSGQIGKLFWRRDALPLYEAGIRLSLAAGDEESAFYFLEKSRAILLLESLLETAVHAEIDPALSEDMDRVEEELLGIRRNLLSANPAPGDARRLLGLTDTLNHLRENLATRYPRLATLLRTPKITSLAQARSNLASGGWDRQIHYFQGKESTYAFELTATTARTVNLGATDSLETNVRQLLSYFAGPTAIDNDPAGFLKVSHRVYLNLFADLNATPGERLLILPDGLLAYLPFNALVTEAGGEDPAAAPYLIRRNELSYAQSATVLARQMAVRKASVGTAFAFSPFVIAIPGNDAPVLPFSGSETQALAKHYGTTLVEGAAANRKALLDGLANQSIIHLSTHAYATPNGAEQPRILTATDPIYLPDVQGLELEAGLVTLSACQSNIGPLAKGEGVLGLGRAFTAAGARGVVASLWSLNDRATADVVTNFYAALAEGAPKPVALHQAQLAYLDRADAPAYLKSPYYWAGLVYYGDGGSLPAGGFSLWWLGLALLGLVGLGLFFWRR